jgi:probable rRNA maturation factor
LSRERFALVLQNAAKLKGTPARNFIEDCARRVFVDAAGELVVRIVDEAESAALNERWLGKQGPTNVLAFPAGDPQRPGRPMAPGRRKARGLPAAPGEPIALGDLAICAAVVAREAAEQGKAPKAHWAHMVIHGCLHLCGYDHMNAAEAKAMETRERELLAGLGIADPYAV